MLPTVKTTLKTTGIALITALSMALSSAAPAYALGKNERNVLKGIAAALIVGAILDANRGQAQPAPRYVEPERRFVEPTRRYVEPTRRYVEPTRRYVEPTRRYVEPTRRHEPLPGRIVGGGAETSIYSTPLAGAFKSYSAAERMTIQRRLAAAGYYRSSVDGSFGPGTYHAVVAYARDYGLSDRTGSREGAFGIYDTLIY